jgi:hypothetical protein
MASRCTVRRLLTAAVVCAALLLGLTGAAGSAPEATRDGGHELSGAPAVLGSFDDAVTAPRPVVVRRSVTVAVLAAVVSILVALVVTRAVPAPGPPHRATASRYMRALRAPPLVPPR